MSQSPQQQNAQQIRVQLETILANRIMILDGAMGTMIQAHDFSEEQFRGEQFKDWHTSVKGNNDMLSLTQPDAISEIHRAYFSAGADIVETNTFNSIFTLTSIFTFSSIFPLRLPSSSLRPLCYSYLYLSSTLHMTPITIAKNKTNFLTQYFFEKIVFCIRFNSDVFFEFQFNKEIH